MLAIDGLRHAGAPSERSVDLTMRALHVHNEWMSVGGHTDVCGHMA